jgi:hypothetical protein
MDAMSRKTTGFLSDEFEELYTDEPIIGSPFAWGANYRFALQEEYCNKIVNDTIITEDFPRMTIKNWPIRVGKRLYEETKKRMLADKEFRKSAVGRAEELMYQMLR